MSRGVPIGGRSTNASRPLRVEIRAREGRVRQTAEKGPTCASSRHRVPARTKPPKIASPGRAKDREVANARSRARVFAPTRSPCVARQAPGPGARASPPSLTGERRRQRRPADLVRGKTAVRLRRLLAVRPVVDRRADSLRRGGRPGRCSRDDCHGGGRPCSDGREGSRGRASRGSRNGGSGGR